MKFLWKIVLELSFLENPFIATSAVDALETIQCCDFSVIVLLLFIALSLRHLALSLRNFACFVFQRYDTFSIYKKNGSSWTSFEHYGQEKAAESGELYYSFVTIINTSNKLIFINIACQCVNSILITMWYETVGTVSHSHFH